MTLEERDLVLPRSPRDVQAEAQVWSEPKNTLEFILESNQDIMRGTTDFHCWRSWNHNDPKRIFMFLFPGSNNCRSELGAGFPL